MAALLCDIQPEDEIITSSFNFVSAVNPFVLRGAKIVFVDIRPDTLNIDETLIEKHITPNTRVILTMHYGGVGCEMEKILEISEKYGLWVIEDAAHCLGAYYGDRHLGTMGHLGAISFHATKNIQCGEGGVLLINDERLLKRAEIIREKGTDRKLFQRGQVDKYSWVDVGSSYLMNEISAAFLWGQLSDTAIVAQKRREYWKFYHEQLSMPGSIQLPMLPENCTHNGHIFPLLTSLSKEVMLDLLKARGIEATFHYVPLHNSRAGKHWGNFKGQDKYTRLAGRHLIRLPLYVDLTVDEVTYITEELKKITREII